TYPSRFNLLSQPDAARGGNLVDRLSISERSSCLLHRNADTGTKCSNSLAPGTIGTGVSSRRTCITLFCLNCRICSYVESESVNAYHNSLVSMENLPAELLAQNSPNFPINTTRCGASKLSCIRMMRTFVDCGVSTSCREKSSLGSIPFL